MTAARTLIAHGFGHGAYDGNFIAVFQRQNIIIIFKKYRTLFRRLTGKLMVGIIVAFIRCFQGFRRPEYLLQYSSYGNINIAFFQHTGFNGLFCILCHIVTAARHIQIAACLKTFDTVVHCTPVGYNQALKTPFGTKNVGQQLLMVAAIGAIQFIVCTHDGSGLALFHRYFKGGKIQFSESTVIHNRVGGKTAQLLRIGCKVLEAGTYTLLFNSPYKCRRQFTCKVRIFGNILEVSAAQRIAFQITSRP